MTAMPPLRDIRNNTPADAIDVDFDFKTLQTHINSELINRDGSVAMTGPLSLPGPPTAPQHATTKAYVDGNVIPVGTIWEFAGIAAPPGWDLCQGQDRSKSNPAYMALFEVIGYNYGGAGDTFKLPDRGARVAVGYKQGDAVAGTLGAKGGRRDAVLVGHDHMTEAHVHAVTVNPQDTNHYHAMRTHTHEMIHHHDSNVRSGFDIIGSNFTGSSNAVYTSPPNQGGNVIFPNTRPTAITQNQVPGGGNQNTSGVQGRADNNWTGGPNDNNTNWLHESGQGTTHAHTASADPRSPKTDTRGETPTNANYPLYEVVNFIIRIG